MNFWEARQAAKAGKKVRMVNDLRATYDKHSFTTLVWTSCEFDAEWEIVEEPSPIVQFVNIYPKNVLPCDVHPSIDSANAGALPHRIACLEIIVDEKGKLISAKTV